MLKRKITQTLHDWRKETNKPCLLLQGARQVGKTFIVDAFARANYDNYMYINFELEPRFKSIFTGDLDWPHLKIGLEANFPGIKLEPGKTLLFLDEIQMCPQARTALKTFALNGTLDVVASGSLLGLYYKEVASYPVGYERAVEMYPLDLEEFLWALGISPDVITVLRHDFALCNGIDAGLLSAFNEYFRQYLLVGGMPAVVNEYLQSHSLTNVRTKQSEIIRAYQNDIMKYASLPDRPKIMRTFESIPVQLGRRNKKFIYADIDRQDTNSSERKYFSALHWLKDAGIINFCYNLTEPVIPLAMRKRLDAFKVYLRDTGLLLALLDHEITRSIVENDLQTNAGSIVENCVGAQIMTRYGDITYYERKSRLEIDFIMNIAGVATAVEIKSGKNREAKSLQSIQALYPGIRRRILLSPEENVYRDPEGVEHYPLFMMMFL